MITLTELRETLPHWQWVAERDGFGWMYRGTQGGRMVTLEHRAGLWGGTNWYVYEQGHGVPFLSWRGAQVPA